MKLLLSFCIFDWGALPLLPLPLLLLPAGSLLAPAAGARSRPMRGEALLLLAALVVVVVVLPPAVPLVRETEPNTFPGLGVSDAPFNEVRAIEPNTFPGLGASASGLDDRELNAEEGLAALEGAAFWFPKLANFLQ
jgi:hypothetical protein